MAFSSNDIKFFLSGGLTNNDPNFSLGGDLSTFFLTSRLFNDVSPTEAIDGKIDYRCIYIENVNETDAFYNMSILISQVEKGATVELGIETLDEKQDFLITNGTIVDSGYFIARYYNLISNEWTEFRVDHDLNIDIWSANFEIALRNISGLENIIVTGTIDSENTVIFSIEFLGNAAKRYQEKIELVSTTDSFNGTTINILKTVSGSPIMKTADEIDVETTIPTGIVFTTLAEGESIFIGDLKPQEFLPIWIKRTTQSDTSALESDGFTIKLSGELA